MSEANPLDELEVRLAEADPKATLDALELIRRLASLQPKKDVLDIDEFAQWLNCHRETAKRDAKAGRFPFFLVGNQFRFHIPTVLDFVHRRYQNKK